MRKLTALILVATLGACTWTKQAAENGKQAAIDCAKQDLGQTVGEAAVSLVMTVVTILATGGTNWEGDLDALGTKYGAEALACAEKTAEAIFRTPVTPETGDKLSADQAQLIAAHARASARISGKSFR